VRGCREQHWKKDPDVDQHIAERFGKVREEVLRTTAAGGATRRKRWRRRSSHRPVQPQHVPRVGQGVQADPLALELCRLALDKGWVDAVPKPLPSFILMPLMHSEDIANQSGRWPNSRSAIL
jgi:uncharacterized protein (DUF924 family)